MGGDYYNHNNNGQIPYDMCSDILSRLPVKSLLRFMSASKQWLSMISSDPHFIQKHFFRTNQNPDVKHTMRAGFSSYQVILDHHQNRITLPFAYSSPPPTRKDDRNDTRVEILASYNGLLLLGIGQKDHFLWNPSTRSYKKIPGNFYHQRDFFRLYGLGYESSSNAYKVIRIVRVVVNWGSTHNTHHRDLPSYDSTTVKIYNSRTNSWRSITHFPYKIFVDQQGLLVNGAPHWIVTRAESEEYVIICFDLVEEKFKELGNPSWLVFDSAFCLGVFNGFLSLLRMDCSEVWVMKEHGKMESWTKLITKDKSMLFESSYAVQIRHFHFLKHFAFQRVEYVESLLSPHIECEATYPIE